MDFFINMVSYDTQKPQSPSSSTKDQQQLQSELSQSKTAFNKKLDSQAKMYLALKPVIPFIELINNFSFGIQNAWLSLLMISYNLGYHTDACVWALPILLTFIARPYLVEKCGKYNYHVYKNTQMLLALTKLTILGCVLIFVSTLVGESYHISRLSVCTLGWVLTDTCQGLSLFFISKIQNSNHCSRAHSYEIFQTLTLLKGTKAGVGKQKDKEDIEEDNKKDDKTSKFSFALSVRYKYLMSGFNVGALGQISAYVFSVGLCTAFLVNSYQKPQLQASSPSPSLTHTTMFINLARICWMIITFLFSLVCLVISAVMTRMQTQIKEACKGGQSTKQKSFTYQLLSHTQTIQTSSNNWIYPSIDIYFPGISKVIKSNFKQIMIFLIHFGMVLFIDTLLIFVTIWVAMSGSQSFEQNYVFGIQHGCVLLILFTVVSNIRDQFTFKRRNLSKVLRLLQLDSVLVLALGILTTFYVSYIGVFVYVILSGVMILLYKNKIYPKFEQMQHFNQCTEIVQTIQKLFRVSVFPLLLDLIFRSQYLDSIAIWVLLGVVNVGLVVTLFGFVKVLGRMQQLKKDKNKEVDNKVIQEQVKCQGKYQQNVNEKIGEQGKALIEQKNNMAKANNNARNVLIQQIMGEQEEDDKNDDFEADIQKDEKVSFVTFMMMQDNTQLLASSTTSTNSSHQQDKSTKIQQNQKNKND